MSAYEPADRRAPARRISVSAAYLLGFGMVFCFGMTVTGALQWLVPAWEARGILLACALIAVEAYASRRLMRQFPTAEANKPFFRITEWVLLFLVIKLYVELMGGPVNFIANLLDWPVEFPVNLLNLRTVLALVTLFSTWMFSTYLDRDLGLLEDENQVAYAPEDDRRVPVRKVIQRRFIEVGILLVLLAGVPSQRILGWSMPPAELRLILPVIAYFVLGFGLTSLTRYITLVNAWRYDRVQVQPQVRRRWLTGSLALLGVLVLIVALLPTSVGMTLLDAIAAFWAVVGIVVSFLISVFFLILSLLGSLFPAAGEATETPTPTPTPGPTPAPMPNILQKTPVINLQMIESLIGWVGTAVVVFFVVRAYIRYQRELAGEMKEASLRSWLALLWRQFIGFFRRANRSVGEYVQGRLKQMRAPRKPVTEEEARWELVNPRHLAPRQKVIFYYLALLRRAGEAGLPRQASETPLEYARSLETEVEQGQEGVEELTGAFLEARYTRHDISNEAGGKVESLWETLRRLFRAKRKR